MGLFLKFGDRLGLGASGLSCAARELLRNEVLRTLFTNSLNLSGPRRISAPAFRRRLLEVSLLEDEGKTNNARSYEIIFKAVLRRQQG